MTDRGASVGTWNAVIRRARIGRERKAVALTLSSYANRDGTGIHCGIATLAVDCEIGYSTARRHLAWLRDSGLVELVRPGNVRRGLSDEYRLTLDADVRKALDVPGDDEYKAMKDDIRHANRAGEKNRRMRGSALTQASADSSRSEPVPDSPSALAQLSAELGDLRSDSTFSALTQVSPHLKKTTYPVTTHPGDTLSPDPLRPDDPADRRNEQENSLTDPPDEITSPRTTTHAAREPTADALSDRCAHGLKARRRPDGSSSCALCRRGVPARPPDEIAPVVPFPTRRTA